MWGLTPSDNNAAINNYKQTHGVNNPCAGTEGGGPAAFNTIINGQNYQGTPTYCIICPDMTMSFDVCWPPSSASCFDPYIEDCMTLAANFASDITEVCELDMVTFSDLSSGEITSWDWTFEGGDPATSTDPNPVVNYNEEGMYDVELTVSDGTESNSMLIEEYISVYAIPEVELSLFDDVCVGMPAFELSGGSPEDGIYSGVGVSDGWFDPAVAGLGTHDITYTFSDSNGCEDFDEQTILVDPCTGIDEVEAGKISIYPNPSKGEFELKLTHKGGVSLNVVNIIGVTIYSEQFNVPGEISRSVDLNGVEAGIYFVTIKTDENTYVKKLRLLD